MGIQLQMREIISVRLFLLPLSCLLLSTPSAHGKVPATPWSVKPYRALLVVERWNDPASVLVDHEKDDFQPVAALLKAWSVPFDILRLDQQHLDGSYLFDRSGEVRYGVVIWVADSATYAGQNLASLEEAAQAGTSLLVARSRFLDPTLERLLGLKFKETYTATDPLRVTQPHYITRELAGRKMDPFDVSWNFSSRLWVGPLGAEVLIDQDHHPMLTLHCPTAESCSIWMGVESLPSLRDSAYWRGLFFRSLVWSLGYIVQPDLDYSHLIEMEMDDWGTADKGFLSYWRYPIPNEETIRQQIIAPLARRRAVAIANVNTGYVDRKSKRIISPWTQKFTDLFGAQQDYASTQKGLKAAVEAGVLEIESHGWTHMQPDLESPPGPWWTADLKGEASADGWYTEFEDRLRGTESPAIVQLVHLKRSREYLQEDFGRTPLSLRPGGAGWSKSYANHTGRLAAQAGFGLFHAEPHFYYYLDRELVLDMTGIAPEAGASYDRPLQAEMWPPHPDGPVMLVFHDRDIALQPGFLDRLFAALPAGYETLSMNRYLAFLHTQIDSSAAAGWQLTFNFDDHYCPYFGHHSSAWRVWLSDAFREKMKEFKDFVVTVDEKNPTRVKSSDLLRETFTIEIPAGLGRHVWVMSPAH